MHIHVHLARRQAHQDHRHRIATGHQQSVISLDDGVGELGILHWTAVDEQGDLAAVGVVERRQASIAGDGNSSFARWRIHGHHLRGHFRPVGLHEDIAQVAAAQRLKAQPTVVEQGEANVRIGHRVAHDDAINVAALGGDGFEELQAGGHAREEMFNGDRCAGGPARRLLRHHLSAIKPEQAAARFVHMARQAGDLAHGGNAGQGLPAKAQRANVIQVVRTGQLAGGVMSKGKPDFSSGNAAAVIGDSDQAPAAIEAFHADIGGVGVNGVLHQLLDHRRRSLNHLTGCDAHDQRIGQNANWHRAFDCKR
jgi:hypothetical protein